MVDLDELRESKVVFCKKEKQPLYCTFGRFIGDDLMWFVEEDIRKILTELPSECSYLDYKEIPYLKNKKHDFIKDVIAMLNSPECIGKKKYIIFGVTDDKKLVGLNRPQPNDNEYQNWADSIVPRPQLQTGTILFDDKEFGYVYLLNTNEYVVHEVKNTVSGEENYKSAGKHAVMQGQAFWRRGSRNEVMMQPDREVVIAHKGQGATQVLAPSNLPPKCGVTNVATLIGAWDENRIGDCKAVELLYGKEYAFFQVELREFYSKNQDIISFSNGTWKTNSRKQLLENIAAGVFDDEIERLRTISLDIIMSTDAFLDLADSDKEKSTYNFLVEAENRYQYSDELRKSVFEFWAYSGNNFDAFTAVSRNKILTCIRDIVAKIIRSDNWKVLITNSKMMPLLAEASPSIFLNEMEDAIRDKSIGLYSALTDDGHYTYAREFAYSLSEAIGLLALYKDYFSKACLCLLAFCDMHEAFMDKISTIMLPWFPQTEADTEVRNGLLKAAFMEYPDSAWRLLLTLLPNQRTNSYAVQSACFLPPANISENGVLTKDYWDEVSKLILIACDQVNINANRLVDLIPIMDDVTENDRTEILGVIKRNFLKHSDSDRYIIWMTLRDFVSDHRKNPDEEWALPQEQLTSIDKLISRFSKDIWLPMERLLFRNDQWELIDHKADSKESEKTLFQEQIAATKRVYELGLDSLISFLEKIENPRVFGCCLANLEITDEVWNKVLLMLEQTNSQYKVFATAFIQEAYRAGRGFIKRYLTDSLPNKAIVLYELLPITSESISVTQRVESEQEKHYWENVDIYGFKPDDENTRDYAICKLIEYDRVKEALGILYSLIETYKVDISAEFVADILIKCPDMEERRVDSYVAEYLLNFIEESSVPEEKKVAIEWKFLNFQTYEQSFYAKAIYRQFENNPEEFMRVFSMMHKGNSDDVMPPFDSGVYRLLEHWKTVPGTKADGTLNSDVFNKWLSGVMSIAMKTKRVDSLEYYLGKLLFYAPASKDGLFIDRTVARLLHFDIKGHMLNGYLVEALNSRGGHSVDETGSTEFKLENEFRERATAVEIEGFTRFSDTLRMIARNYHDEALHNIEEAKKWRSDEEKNQ